MKVHQKAYCTKRSVKAKCTKSVAKCSKIHKLWTIRTSVHFYYTCRSSTLFKYDWDVQIVMGLLTLTTGVSGRIVEVEEMRCSTITLALPSILNVFWLLLLTWITSRTSILTWHVRIVDALVLLATGVYISHHMWHSQQPFCGPDDPWRLLATLPYLCALLDLDLNLAYLYYCHCCSNCLHNIPGMCLGRLDSPAHSPALLVSYHNPMCSYWHHCHSHCLSDIPGCCRDHLAWPIRCLVHMAPLQVYLVRFPPLFALNIHALVLTHSATS